MKANGVLADNSIATCNEYVTPTRRGLEAFEPGLRRYLRQQGIGPLSASAPTKENCTRRSVVTWSLAIQQHWRSKGTDAPLALGVFAFRRPTTHGHSTNFAILRGGVLVGVEAWLGVFEFTDEQKKNCAHWLV